jgi:hypothetical protein
MADFDLLPALRWEEIRFSSFPLVLPADWDPSAHLEGTGEWVNVSWPPFGMMFWREESFAGFERLPVAPPLNDASRREGYDLTDGLL